jgi:crossover junction endodeoxyribonuclease RusA
MTLAFRVYGVPQTKGNMRAIRVKGMTFPIVTDSNRSAKSWQQLVAEHASRAIEALPAGDRVILTRGVRLSVQFFLPRPKKYQRAGVAVAHLNKPDTSKLLRAVEDALTQVAYADDAQVVELLATKAYAPVGAPPYVDIRVEATHGTGALAVTPAPQSLFTGHESPVV